MRQLLYRRLKFWHSVVLLNAILALTHVASVQAQNPKTSTPLVVDDVTVVDVTHGQLISNQRVVILGTRIQQVGPAKATPVPAGAQIIPATGKFLIPGLWDMHAHTRSLTGIYPLLVANGVTGIREMSSDWPQGYDSLLHRRQEIATGALIGPRIIATSHDFYTLFCHQYAAPFLAFMKEAPDHPGCVKPNDNTVSSPEEVRRWVDTLHAHHVDFVKAHMVGDSAIYLAMLNEARRVGIPAVGHLGSYEGHVNAIEASDSGLKSVEHITEMECWQDGFSAVQQKPAPDSVAERRCGEVAQHFLRNKTWLVPTLYYYQQGQGTAMMSGTLYQNLKHAVDLVYRLGIPMMAGTDMTTDGGDGSLADLSVRAGALQTELTYLVDAGFSPVDALRAATVTPATFFGATDSLGTIAAGKLADCVLLNANPLADIHNTRNIQAVFVNGRYLNREMLDTLVRSGSGQR